MKGNTLTDFIDDLLSMGGPEKEFVFHDRFFFLQSSCDGNHCTLVIDEYDNTIPQEKRFLKSHRFSGKTLAECVSAFEKAPIFHGLTLYEAENAIEVLFG